LAGYTQGGGPSRYRGTGLALGYYLPPLRGFRLRRGYGGQVRLRRGYGGQVRLHLRSYGGQVDMPRSGLRFAAAWRAVPVPGLGVVRARYAPSPTCARGGLVVQSPSEGQRACASVETIVRK
jgi:hypothetical protein